MEVIGDAEEMLSFVKSKWICEYGISSLKFYGREENKVIVEEMGWEKVMANRYFRVFSGE